MRWRAKGYLRNLSGNWIGKLRKKFQMLRSVPCSLLWSHGVKCCSRNSINQSRMLYSNWLRRSAMERQSTQVSLVASWVATVCTKLICLTSNHSFPLSKQLNSVSVTTNPTRKVPIWLFTTRRLKLNFFKILNVFTSLRVNVFSTPTRSRSTWKKLSIEFKRRIVA